MDEVEPPLNWLEAVWLCVVIGLSAALSISVVAAGVVGLWWLFH